MQSHSIVGKPLLHPTPRVIARPVSDKHLESRSQENCKVALNKENRQGRQERQE